MSAAPQAAAGRAWPESLPSPGLTALGVAGALVALLVVAGWAAAIGPSLAASPAGRLTVVACGASMLAAVGLAPPRIRRWDLLASGAAALGALAALAALADPYATAIVLLLLGGLQAARSGGRPFALRMRGPTLAALLVGAGWLLIRSGSLQMGRVGALALALGIAAAAGLLPYAQELDPDEPAATSCIVWTGFFGPALALTLPSRLLPSLKGEALIVFGLTLVGLGLLNLGWGVVAAWRAAEPTEAWRSSFLAEWGLALTGLGLGVLTRQPAGLRAAYLLLLAIVVVRLPLYVWSRPVLRGRARARTGALNIAVALALAGAAPFAGFPARLDLLLAASQAAWPLALILVVAMLAWIAHAFRLGRTLGAPSARTGAGVAIALAASLALGLAPSAFTGIAGL